MAQGEIHVTPLRISESLFMDNEEHEEHRKRK